MGQRNFGRSWFVNCRLTCETEYSGFEGMSSGETMLAVLQLCLVCKFVFQL